MKICVVHDWLPLFSGAEEVLRGIMETIGPSDLYTLFDFLNNENRSRIGARLVIKSYLNSLPYCKSYYRWTFPFCPAAIESFDLSEYELVISSSAAFSKGVIVHPHQRHISYVHSPVRYAWDQSFQYLAGTSLARGVPGLVLRVLLHNLRIWDTRTSNGPDILIANSTSVQRRIEQTYGRSSIILFPPVELDDFPMCNDKDDYFVVASRLVPYKRIDLVVNAFTQMPNQRLIVVGDGPEMKRLQSSAGSNITLTGHVSRPKLSKIVSRARAFVFAGYEDFGIALAEAQAAGTPLLAYKYGGAVDIIRTGENPTGLFFDEQSVEAIKDAVQRFLSQERLFVPQACNENARRFSRHNFSSRLTEIIDMAIDPCFNRNWVPFKSAAVGGLNDRVPSHRNQTLTARAPDIKMSK